MKTLYRVSLRLAGQLEQSAVRIHGCRRWRTLEAARKAAVLALGGEKMVRPLPVEEADEHGSDGPPRAEPVEAYEAAGATPVAPGRQACILRETWN
jgi:hypothetical protein